MFITGNKVKYFTKDTLIAANSRAINTQRNRTLHPEPISKLPNLRFPVVFSMIHNDCEMRVGIMVGPDADKLQLVYLDVPFDTYNKLPEVEIDR